MYYYFIMILVTGGLGFIGSHIIVELLENNYNVLAVDNLVNSKLDTATKIKKIVGDKFENFVFENIDVKNEVVLNDLFKAMHSKCNTISHVIHCAGLKAVGESVKNPLLYYNENLNLLLTLVKVMEQNNCYNLIFSSSATVYGAGLVLQEPQGKTCVQPGPLIETNIVGQGISNPYGQTKFMQEQILKDIVISNSKWSITSLRYFNPIGAHSSGILGEDPKGLPNNLMPYLLKVCIYNYLDKSIDNNLNEPMSNYKYLNVFGNDYNTLDGTAERDYIHVVDLARAHVLSLKSKIGYSIYNIGTGKPTSVLQLINQFNKINNITVPYKICNRRPGDLDITYCNNQKAKEELNFEPKLTIDDMVRDSWNYVLHTYNKI
jgi:UDP-glucose 4-epimerase